jgi:NADH:ubiquinone oxidoreductase subunit E
VNQVQINDLIDEMLSQHNMESSSPLIPVLQAIQNQQGYLSEESLRIVSDKTGTSLSRVYGVATFYHQFRLRPEGKHKISICRGTACHVASATDLYNQLVKELGLSPDEDTSADGLFTLHEVRCLGACSLAPVVKVDETVYGKMTGKKLQEILNQYKEEQQ